MQLRVMPLVITIKPEGMQEQALEQAINLELVHSLVIEREFNLHFALVLALVLLVLGQQVLDHSLVMGQ